ncbi:hypothetical protein J6590_069083 [Homalodisca vitripennis]|nr:hypothetical protein J6590_069083 [Homalodisca vitripennis]
MSAGVAIVFRNVVSKPSSLRASAASISSLMVCCVEGGEKVCMGHSEVISNVLGSEKSIIGCYNPIKQNEPEFIKRLNISVETIKSKYKHVVFMGDINIDILVVDKRNRNSLLHIITVNEFCSLVEFSNLYHRFFKICYR